MASNRVKKLRLLVQGILGAIALLCLLHESIARSRLVKQILPSQPVSGSEISPLTAIIVARQEQSFDSSTEALGLSPVDDVVVYIANNATAPLHPSVNKGNEAMSFLTYLIDHYENLPGLMLFMHAHP